MNKRTRTKSIHINSFALEAKARKFRYHSSSTQETFYCLNTQQITGQCPHVILSVIILHQPRLFLYIYKRSCLFVCRLVGLSFIYSFAFSFIHMFFIILATSWPCFFLPLRLLFHSSSIPSYFHYFFLLSSFFFLLSSFFSPIPSIALFRSLHCVLIPFLI